MASCYMRSSTVHGGSCIFLHNNLQFRELEHLKSKSVESVIECSAVEIINAKIIIICIYHPPRADFNIFINTLEDILLSVTSKIMQNHIITVCGDFNLDIQNTLDRNVKIFLDLMTSFDLKPTISEPTRINIRNNTAKTIDNIFFVIPIR